MALLYDLGRLSYVGSLGCFTTAWIAFAIAILYEKNQIFPKWFAYVTVWQMVTEVMAVPVFISKAGPFAWHRHLRHLDLVPDRPVEEGERTAAHRRGAAAMTDTEQTATAQDTKAAPSSSRPEHMPGDGAMWVMVLGDFVFFGAYFIIFMIQRAMAPEEFLQSQQNLNLAIGVVNTLVLLTSSWFIARGVQAARSGDHNGAVATMSRQTKKNKELRGQLSDN
jgi:hypothetical protein